MSSVCVCVCVCAFFFFCEGKGGGVDVLYREDQGIVCGNGEDMLCREDKPQGSRDLNDKVLGPKYHCYYGILALEPYYLGPKP